MPPFLLNMEELCPSCGDFAVLNERTGWCRKCTTVSLCKCGRPITSGGKLCSVCKRIEWEKKNSVRIAHFLHQGYPRYMAIQKVREENRVICAGCGTEMKGAKLGSVICRRNTQCRSLYWRVVHYKRKHNIEGMKEAYERFNAE
jgi:hypothetical protein